MPQAAVFENLADEVRLMGLDEGDDLHGPAAFGAQQRVGLVDVFDENGPTTEVEPGRFWPFWPAFRLSGWLFGGFEASRGSFEPVLQAVKACLLRRVLPCGRMFSASFG